MIEFITGPSGSGKSTVMIDKIQELLNKNKEICIIVPEQYSYDFDKKLYFKLGPKNFNKVTSLSFKSLARQLFQLFGEINRNGEYADEYTRMIFTHLAILNVQKNPESMQYFTKISRQQGFAEEVIVLITELKRSGITPEKIKEKSVFFDNKLQRKINDISLIFLEYEKLMNKYGYKDNLDDLKFASEISKYNNYFEGKYVFFDEFESFTGDQLNFLETIISSSAGVCITLRTDDVYAGEYTLFETVNKTYRSIVKICLDFNKKFINISCKESFRFKNDDIKYLSTNILRNKEYTHKSTVPEPENIQIFEAKDLYTESEYVCASIKHLVYSDKSLKYRDIAIISNNINAYSDVLRSAFERYEIPYFLNIEKTVIHTSLMVFFNTLIDIINKSEYNSEYIFKYLKCGLLGIDLIDISLLENYCYKWSIDKEIWLNPFTANDINLDKLEQLRKQIINPLEEIKQKLKKNISVHELCTILYKFLIENKVEFYLSSIMGELIKENKDYEAAEIKRLWGCLINILDSMSNTLKNSKMSFGEISNIIKSMLGKIKYSSPPQTLDSITVASARTARLNSPRVVFIMGATDGDFPNTVKINGLFSEADKYKLSQNGIEISRSISDIIASERLVVYKSLSSASEKLFITYPLSDLSGKSKYPASVISEIFRLFDSNKMLKLEPEINVDFYAVTMKSAFYHYMQYRSNNDKSIASIKEVLIQNQYYKRKIEYIFIRLKKQPDFKITRETMQKLKNFSVFNISPSTFELYNICQFKYFCKECLKLFINEKVELDKKFSGSLIHSCFYKIISTRSKDDFIKLSYNELKEQIIESAKSFKSTEMGGEFSKAPGFELSFNKLTERLVNVFIHTQQEIMISDFIPTDFEFKLRDKNSKSTLELEFAGDKKLSFGGIIDRIDVCTINNNKYVRIIDYKSGKKTIDAISLSNGINMQMLLYLFSITDKKSLYSDYEPAGVLYSPASINSIKPEEKKEKTLNINEINSILKTNGLIINDKIVLEAMEHGINGKYIPAKLDKNNKLTKNSECINKEDFMSLKKFCYQKLIDMADSVYNGNIKASPLLQKNKNLECEYCNYINICGNNSKLSYRKAEEYVSPEIIDILENSKKESELDGMD